MLEPLTNQSNQQIAQLQAQLARLEQENTELRSRLETCQLEQQSQSDENLQPMQIARDRIHDSYVEHRLLEATAKAANALLTIADFEQAVNMALQILGESLETDRTKVLESLFDDAARPFSRYHNVLYEWIKPGTVQQQAHTQAGQVDTRNLENFFETFVKNKGFGGLLAEWDESLHPVFQTVEVKSVYAVPICVDEQWWGVLAFDDCREAKHRTIAEMAALQTAANCIGSAIQRQRMQRTQKEAERQVLLEREKAASERAAELAKANEALQSTIDALAKVGDLDEFVPAVLQIVGQTFGTQNCAFYEHSSDGTIYLRYWKMDNRVLRPADLLALDGDRFALVHRLAQGFTVPDAYLGTPVCERTRAVVLDHTVGTAAPEFDAFAGKNGWDVELNVPLVVDGFANGTLLIYRPVGATFTQSDIALAETLGQQLALAMQASHLAAEGQSRAVEAAIAKEQEKAATERAAELAKANEVLRRTASQLIGQQDLNHFLNSLLLEVAQEVGAVNCSIFLCTRQANTYRMYNAVEDGQVIPLETDPRFELWRTPISKDNENWKLIQSRGYIWSLLETDEIQSDRLCDFSIHWHHQMQHRSVMCVLLQVGDEPLGYMGLCFRELVEPSPERISFIEALANQAALAIQLTQLAEEAKLAAIAKEQEKAATERAAELAKANEALKRSLDSLATEPSLDKFLGQVLTAIAEQFDSPLTEYWYHNEGDIAYIGLINWQGQIYDRQSLARLLPNHSGLNGCRIPSELLDAESLQHRKRYFVQKDLDISPFTKNLPGKQEWYTVFGHLNQELNLPMVLGDTCIGALNVRLQNDRLFTREQIELAQALTHQATLAVELSRLAEQSRHAVLLEERNRMAREIHDTLAQSFTGVIIQLEAAQEVVASEPPTAIAHLNRAGELAREGLSEARRSVWRLRPEALESQDLPTALLRTAQKMTHGTAIEVEVFVSGTPDELPTAIECNLLRIGQEALTNILKHAQAQTVQLTLRFDATAIHLQISDDGQGFEPQQQTSKGFGIISMQERTQQLGGQFQLTSQSGNGTSIIVTIPI